MKLESKQFNDICFLDECEIVVSKQYGGKKGDSFVYPVGKHKNSKGNNSIDGSYYEHGIEGCVVRNNDDEVSWAYSIFYIGGKFKTLTGECKLIDSENIKDINTTVEFWNNEELLNSYLLTPDNVTFDIELDVSKCRYLRICIRDNESQNGVTSIGLFNLKLSKFKNIQDSVKTYSGTFIGTKGKTEADLTILSIDEDQNVSALFSFHEHDENPGVPTGSFSMSGNVVGITDENEIIIDLKGEQWISKPTGYQLISFKATIDSEREKLISKSYNMNLSTAYSNDFNSIDGIYSGTYIAGQGKTNVVLSISKDNETSKYKYNAVFNFSANEDNPNVPSGSYKCTGSVAGVCRDGKIYVYFQGDEWISHPANYSMINFTLIFNSESTQATSDMYSVNIERNE